MHSKTCMYGLNDQLARIVMAYIDTLLTSIHVFLEILPNPYMFSRRIPIGIYPERALLTVTAGTSISRYPFLSFTYLLIPIFIFFFVTLSVVSLVFSTLVATSFYSILISIYSEFYLQTTLSHYHRTRLRIYLTTTVSSAWLGLEWFFCFELFRMRVRGFMLLIIDHQLSWYVRVREFW